MSTLKFLKKNLTADEVEAEISSIYTKITSCIQPRAIYLFGSCVVNGGMTDQSDVDILILCESSDEIRFFRRKISSIRPFSRFPVDIVWMTASDFLRKAEAGGVAQIVREEGRLIYGEKL